MSSYTRYALEVDEWPDAVAEARGLMPFTHLVPVMSVPLAQGVATLAAGLAPVAQGLGPLASPPGLLVALVVLAVVLLVGRVVLALAWRLVLLAIAAVAVLWLLGVLGFQTGIL